MKRKIYLNIAAVSIFLTSWSISEAKMIHIEPTLKPGTSPDSKAALEFCLDTHSSKEKLSACKRSTFAFCVLNSPNHEATDLVESGCADHEAELWKSLVEDDYKKIASMPNISEKQKDSLKISRDSWLKSESALCYVVSQMEGSTYYVGRERSNCDLDQFSQRLIDLYGLQDELRR